MYCYKIENINARKYSTRKLRHETSDIVLQNTKKILRK